MLSLRILGGRDANIRVPYPISSMIPGFSSQREVEPLVVSSAASQGCVLAATFLSTFACWVYDGNDIKFGVYGYHRSKLPAVPSHLVSLNLNLTLSPDVAHGSGSGLCRGGLVEKLPLEDGPERTISFWREDVVNNANRHVTGATGGADPGGDGGGGGGGGGKVRRNSGRRNHGIGGVLATRWHPVSPLYRIVPADTEAENLPRSRARHCNPPRCRDLARRTPTPLPSPASTPQKATQRGTSPSSPSVGGPKASKYSTPVSDTTSHTKVEPAPAPAPAPASHGSNHKLKSVPSSCQPSLLHLLSILEELGVQRVEHMTALVRMRETRNRGSQLEGRS
ncbi:hypothetical protein BC827DRAFT_1262992 [Russula dissimulans]|nr:hypothetical protein BC827DRAFT_1262992 [Russula dissimulans]